MPKRRRLSGDRSVTSDSFLTRVPHIEGPVKKSRSITYVPVRRYTTTRYIHRDLFYPPAYETAYDGEPALIEDVKSASFKGTQITVSEGHPNRQLRADGADLGGEFFTERKYVEGLHGRTWTIEVRKDYLPGHVGFDTRYFKYSGPFCPIDLRGPNGIPANLFPANIHSSDEVMNERGATAVARCKPTNSIANVASFLGELRSDGLPSLPFLHSLKSRTLSAKNAGGEFLNYEFGWAPLVSDLQSFSKAVHSAGTVLKQFRRDNGRVVRRRYMFPLEKSTDAYTWNQYDPARWYSYPTWASNTFQAACTDPDWPTSNATLTRETVREVWFSGAFTYHIPVRHDVFSDLMRAAQQAQKLSGLLPTPDQVWAVAPWSWAVDWFTNMGDIITNISDQRFYGLIMRYGYIMETISMKDTYTCDPVRLSDGQIITFPPISFVTVTKQRKKANPFGFGVTWEGLSPLQVSILTALGISRRK